MNEISVKIKTWWQDRRPTVRDVICILIGAVMASWISLQLYNWRIQEATQQSSIIYNKNVYDIKQRIVQ